MIGRKEKTDVSCSTCLDVATVGVNRSMAGLCCGLKVTASMQGAAVAIAYSADCVRHGYDLSFLTLSPTAHLWQQLPQLHSDGGCSPQSKQCSEHGGRPVREHCVCGRARHLARHCSRKLADGLGFHYSLLLSDCKPDLLGFGVHFIGLIGMCRVEQMIWIRERIGFSC